jgi:flavin-dependent dehydrogenase
MFTQFIQRQFPHADVKTIKGGAIACGHSALPLAADNLFKVGDAANMVNPISRAGILEAMLGGKLAAEAALKIIETDSPTEKNVWYSAYKTGWDQVYGKNHLRIHKAKQGFSKVSDNTFSRAADRLSGIPQEKLSMGKIFLSTLAANPLVLWHMRGMIVKK